MGLTELGNEWQVRLCVYIYIERERERVRISFSLGKFLAHDGHSVRNWRDFPGVQWLKLLPVQV